MKRELILIVMLLLVGCKKTRSLMSNEELMDPANCETCHPDHTREWAGSMHAYAADDPVFLAMNARGQRETQGALGDFCVQCHAPMALQTGATTDGLNLGELPQHLKGVTCYFCHSVAWVTGDHNAALLLANDGVMRGGIPNPVNNTAHQSAYSPLLDRNDLDSSNMCGACHDIVNSNGVHLERTFAEWKETVFAQDTPARQTCGHCHLRGKDGLAADSPGVFLRRVHDHSMVGVDVALTTWPDIEGQTTATQEFLDSTVNTRLCVNPGLGGGVELVVRLENVAAGHKWPSGAGQDRRGWVELMAYQGESEIFSSGVVAQGQAVTDLSDPNLWLLRDTIYGDENKTQEVHMFWEAASYDSSLLGGAVTTDPSDPAFFHYQERTYSIEGQVPDRVTLRVLLRPMGLDVLNSLVNSGDLSTEYISKIETFALANAQLEWTGEVGDCVP